MKAFARATLVVVLSLVASQVKAVAIVNANFDTVWDNNINQNQQAITPAAYTSGFGTQTVNYFDEGDGIGTGPASAYFPGWTSGGNAAVQFLQTDASLGPFFNANEQTGFNAYLNASSSIEQVLSSNLLADTLYTLTFDVGKRLDFGNTWNASVYTVELLAGATSLSLTTVVKPNPSTGNFDAATFTYTSPSSGAIIGQALTIRFSTTTEQVDIDNVALDAVAVPTPEPTSFVTLLLGVIGLMPVVRRRR